MAMKVYINCEYIPSTQSVISTVIWPPAVVISAVMLRKMVIKIR